MSNLVILHRKLIGVNTDPQRRYYNGCYFNSELRWTEWGVFEIMRFLKPGTDPEDRLKFWRELNDYAVSQRGESARSEFKVEAVQEAVA